MPPLRPYRSVLYIPGSKPRALEKARTLPADAIIFDLEDAVTPDEKAAARETLSSTLKSSDYGARAKLVRINGFDTEWGEDDLAQMAGAGADGILLPKVSAPEQIADLSRRMDGLGYGETQVWAMIETCEGILNVAAIAAAPRLAGFVLGTNDLAKELGCRSVPDRGPLQTSLQLSLLAARAHGLVCLDGVYNAYKDEEGLRAECVQGRDLGYDGKTLIHPAQVEIANEVFAPSDAEVALARRQIEAFEAAEAAGQGVAVVDGRIVENLHVETARKTLAMAEAIAAGGGR
jgi:(3S)-malyl-CoA thioesterase